MLRSATPLVLLLVAAPLLSGETLRFPDGMLLGTGMCNSQTEGAWNEDGKSPSVMDYYYHIRNASENPDVACDHYHKYEEDINTLAELNMSAFRFSIAWARVLPTGLTDAPNEKGIAFYNNVINLLVAKNITPIITIYHFDHPQALQELCGGWQNATMVDYYLNYTNFIFKTYGDRVKYWLTVNEPYLYCTYVYGKAIIPPATESPGHAEYQCIHHMLLAHGRAYRSYYANFSSYEGKIGIAIDSQFGMPLNESDSNIMAADRQNTFEVDMILSPLYYGRYPDEVERHAAKRKNTTVGRLAYFTSEEADIVNGTLDFVALNLYHGYYTYFGKASGISNLSLDSDVGVITETEPGAAAVTSAQSTSVIHPWILRTVPLYVLEHYGNVSMFITENGFSDYGGQGLEDTNRISFFNEYLSVLLRTIDIYNIDIIGYLAWSYLDSFELGGYSVKLGLVDVDFNSTNRTRTPKESSYYLAKVFGERRLDYSSSAAFSSFSSFLLLITASVWFLTL